MVWRNGKNLKSKITFDDERLGLIQGLIPPYTHTRSTARRSITLLRGCFELKSSLTVTQVS